MRIAIKGENDAARELAGMLRHEGYAVTDDRPTHTIYLEEDATVPEDNFVVDGIECLLERRVMENIFDQTNKNPIMSRVGGIQNDHEVRIKFAPADANEVAIGTFRGIIEALNPHSLPTKRQSFWKRIFL